MRQSYLVSVSLIKFSRCVLFFPQDLSCFESQHQPTSTRHTHHAPHARITLRQKRHLRMIVVVVVADVHAPPRVCACWRHLVSKYLLKTVRAPACTARGYGRGDFFHASGRYLRMQHACNLCMQRRSAGPWLMHDRCR